MQGPEFAQGLSPLVCLAEVQRWVLSTKAQRGEKRWRQGNNTY